MMSQPPPSKPTDLRWLPTAAVPAKASRARPPVRWRPRRKSPMKPRSFVLLPIYRTPAVYRLEALGAAWHRDVAEVRFYHEHGEQAFAGAADLRVEAVDQEIDIVGQ